MIDSLFAAWPTGQHVNIEAVLILPNTMNPISTLNSIDVGERVTYINCRARSSQREAIPPGVDLRDHHATLIRGLKSLNLTATILCLLATKDSVNVNLTSEHSM